MNKYTRMNWENTPSKATPLTADNLNHMDEGIEQVTDGAIALEAEVNQLKGNAEIDETSLETVKSEITSARGEYDSLGQRLDTLIDGNEQGQVDTFNLAEGAVTAEIIADRAITLSKLSIELLAMLNTINNKADKATTLDGYGITDAYTKTTVKTLLAGKLDAMSFDSEPTLNSPCYLTSGAVYNALLAKADVNSVYSKTETDNSLREKADKAEVTNQLSELKEDLVNLYSLNNIKIIETLSNYAIDKMAYSSTGVLGNNDSIVCTEKMLLKSKTVYCDSKILLYALFDSNKNFISRTSLSTSSNIVTIDDDKACYIALMFNRNAYDFDVIKVSNIKGVYEIISPVILNVGVEKEYTRVIDALRVAENITDKKVIINIFEGTYDIYSELGGDDFVASISSTAIWSDIQPVLKGNVDIIGHGDVSLTLNIPSAVKNSYPYQATRISIINNKGSILVKNIKFITSNNRYCVHDEVDNNSAYDNSEHKFIGCQFISTHATHNVGMGVGHSIYSFENCYFEHDYGSCLYIHGWYKLLGAKITISNCILNNTHPYGKGLIFGVNSVNETDVLILSSHMKNIYVDSENTSIYAKNIYRIICLNCNVTEVLYADSITEQNIAPKLFN